MTKWKSIMETGDYDPDASKKEAEVFKTVNGQEVFMKFNPDAHFIGKIYNLTKKNFNALLKDWERLKEEETHRKLPPYYQCFCGRISASYKLIEHRQGDNGVYSIHSSNKPCYQEIK